jgi:hypothetical protein
MRRLWTSLLCASLICPSGKGRLLARTASLTPSFEEEAIVAPLTTFLHNFTRRYIWQIERTVGFDPPAGPRVTYPDRGFYVVKPNDFRLIGEYNEWMDMEDQPDPVKAENTPAFSVFNADRLLNPAQIMSSMIYTAIGFSPSPSIDDLPGQFAQWHGAIRLALGTVDGQLRNPVLDLILPGHGAGAAAQLTQDLNELIEWVKQETSSPFPNFVTQWLETQRDRPMRSDPPTRRAA